MIFEYTSLNGEDDAYENPRLFGKKCVIRSIHNLLNTKPKTRLFRPEGFSLPSLLFNLDNGDFEHRVKTLIYSLLSKEPRISFDLNSIGVFRDDNKPHLVKITLNVVLLEDTTPISLEGYLSF